MEVVFEEIVVCGVELNGKKTRISILCVIPDNLNPHEVIAVCRFDIFERPKLCRCRGIGMRSDGVARRG